MEERCADKDREGAGELERAKEKGEFICTKTLPVTSSHSVAVVLVSHSDAHQEGENGPIRFLEKSETSLRLFFGEGGKRGGERILTCGERS